MILYDESCLHVRIFMIMASTHRRELEAVLVKTPRWKRENIGYIDPAEPPMIRNGREHYLIHWDNRGFSHEYVDCSFVHKMEDVSKSKCTWYSPDQVWISSEQCVALKGLWKSRALGTRLFEESSSRQRRIVEEDDTLELSIDPFAEVLPEETGQKRSPKPLPQQRRQAVQKGSPQPSPQQAAQKRSPKPPPTERLRLQAAQKRSSQVGKEDVQASKPLPEGSKKSPTMQEKSKKSSWRRRLIMEEDDKMFPCNIDPFSEELVYRFEAQDKNEAVESYQSSQENCF